MVYLLMDQKRITANDLATHFEVSKRTILRDINTLSAAGVPIYTRQGKGGGICIHDHFVLNKAFISEDEKKQILFALQSMAATELLETDQTLGRLRNFFAGPKQDWIEVDFSRWGHSATDAAKFDTLKQAILSESAVSFDYLSPQGASKNREVFPLRMAFKSKAWYLVSFCTVRDEYRTFKFSRISNLTRLDKTFDNRAYVPPKIEPELPPAAHRYVAVTVRIAPEALYRLYDEFLEDDITPHGDGIFTLRMEQAPWIPDYVLSFGTALEVLAPAYLREEMRTHVEKIKNKYLSKHDA